MISETWVCEAMNTRLPNRPNTRNSAMVASTGLEMGSTICPKMRSWAAPSILADSMIASGMVERKNDLHTMMLNEETASGRISDHTVSDKRSRLVLIT